MPLSQIQTINNQVIPNLGRRNLIINGGMQVAQRATSATSLSSGGYHTLDRFYYYINAFDELRTTMSQDSSVPTGTDSGFSKSLKLDCTTAESAIAADENLRVWQIIEAQNLIRLGYGTSGAKTCTLSFYVKSSLTGTYAVSFWCQDPNRNISKTYTINSANTWEKKTITIPGDTGGTGITNDNGEGMRINWFLNAGSNFTSTDTNNQWGAFASGRHAFGHTAAWGTNTSHDFFLTGVQFEVGDSATDFEHLSVAEELALCQRYHYRRDIGIYDIVAIGHALGDRGGYVLHTPVSMRVKPSVTQGSHIHCWYNNAGSVTAQNNLVVGYMATGQTNANQFYLRADSNSTVQTGYGLGLTMYDSSATSSHIALDSEL